MTSIRIIIPSDFYNIQIRRIRRPFKSSNTLHFTKCPAHYKQANCPDGKFRCSPHIDVRHHPVVTGEGDIHAHTCNLRPFVLQQTLRRITLPAGITPVIPWPFLAIKANLLLVREHHTLRFLEPRSAFFKIKLVFVVLYTFVSLGHSIHLKISIAFL